MTNKSVWETLNAIDVSKHIEKKGQFSYLSWAWAWATLKEHYPEASFIKHVSQKTDLPYLYDGESGTAYVQVTVSAGDMSVTEVFPVLNHNNKPVISPSSFDVNVALQRCMTKSIAYLGLGAYIYAGEDLPAGPKVAMIEGEEARGIDVIAETFAKFIPLKTKIQELEKFWSNNKDALAILKREDVSLYEKVLVQFKKRKADLNNGTQEE